MVPSRWRQVANLVFASILFLLGIAVQGASTPSTIPKDTLPADPSIDHLPLGLEERLVPKDNPLTMAKVKLGRKLFFDPILSGDGTVACASCHRPDRGFSSAEPK